MTNHCPRCDTTLEKEKKKFGTVDLTEWGCNACGTRLYFAEDITAFLVAQKK